METRTHNEKDHTQQAIEEVKTAARQAGEHLKAGANEMVEAGHESVRRLGNAWDNAKSNLQDKAVTSVKATDRVIRDHPYESLGIAFGVGVLIGVLINRK